MTALNPDDMGDFMTKIGLKLPSDLRVEHFKDFGKMTSNIYRTQLFAIFNQMKDKEEFSYESIGPIIFFATLIKNKDRILKGLAALQAKYGTSKWFKDSIKFYTTKTEQYVSETDGSAGKKFPVVNITTCMPDVAAHMMKQYLRNVGEAFSDDKMYRLFSENLWFVQLRVSKAEIDIHKEWERNFWNTVVKKTKNKDSSRYMAERGFNENYWQTKADDDYPFIVAGKPSEVVFDKAAILAWLKSA